MSIIGIDLGGTQIRGAVIKKAVSQHGFYVTKTKVTKNTQRLISGIIGDLMPLCQSLLYNNNDLLN